MKKVFNATPPKATGKQAKGTKSGTSLKAGPLKGVAKDKFGSAMGLLKKHFGG